VEGLAARSAGQPLSSTERAFLEPRFGHDFARVRVHADGESGAAAARLHAAAFTTGSDVFVDPALYAAGSPAGDYLLAHEMAHVVQNERHEASASHLARDSVSQHNDAAESEADLAAARVHTGGTAQVSAAPSAAVARFEFSPEALWNTITDNRLSGALGFMTEASKTAASPVARGLGLVGAAGESSGLPQLGRALGPLGIISNVMTMGKALDTGGLQGAGDFTAGGMGVVSSLAPTMELGAAGASALGLEGASTSMLAGAEALGPVGALAGSFAGGYALGGYLSENTTVGEHAVNSMGTIDSWLTGEGEESWMLRTSEGVSDDWDKGNYGSAALGGLKLGGAATLGALGGLGGGLVDVAKSAGSGIADAATTVGGGIKDAASYVADNTTLDPGEIDWGRTLNPFEW
jgi:hypothetical protein